MKYRKKPVVVDAIQCTGENYTDIEEFLGDPLLSDEYDGLLIDTLEGKMIVGKDDYTIKK
ncbi:hypothetical protein ABE060_00310 [Bacillus rugosus]|uniref:hypothetical protein n=1 Tax=Bacillus rugosus TaxID=2715209 RepID=UPI00141F8568|nr:hypothetical protein [Bacillus rugosus]MEC1548817.1 hypothetical protein [Bacillus rugosus]NUF05404.1 hypothetical protein [Bacillus rugosus]